MRGIITTNLETLAEFGGLAKLLGELEDFAKDVLERVQCSTAARLQPEFLIIPEDKITNLNHFPLWLLLAQLCNSLVALLSSPDPRLSAEGAYHLESFVASMYWCATNLDAEQAQLAALHAKGSPESWCREEGHLAFQIGQNCDEILRVFFDMQMKYNAFCKAYGISP